MEILSLIIIGLCAGSLSGLFGMGGGIILVPGLLISGVVSTQHQAQALSLGVLLLPVALPAFIRYYRQEKRYISLKFIGLIVLGNIVGSLGGATLASMLSNFWLSKIYGIILLWQGIKILREYRLSSAKEAELTQLESSHVQHLYRFLLTGLITGFVSGLVGIGGAMILIPILLYFGYTQHQAQGYSLGVFSLPLGSLMSFLIYKKHNFLIHFGYVPLIAGSFILSSFLFSRLALSIPSRKLKFYFTILVIINAVYFIVVDRA